MSRDILSSSADWCRRHPALAAMLVAAVMFIPSAVLTPFNTKGEPREAIVALSMLMSGDWVLPVSFGADIPYKPPFLAWMIALLSLPAGHVTELSARLPSIMAAMSLAAIIASFARRDMGWSGARPLAAALIMLTTVEVWRGAGACRVDMVLTAAVTGAVVMLYRLALHGGFMRFVGATALMTVAVLTKGPVGMVLPCLIIAVWAMTARLGTRRFMTLAAIVAAAAILSLCIPAWWYAEAYNRGGQRFYDLAMEENLGRMTGTMSYASHENPWWYNLQTLAAGLLPYTLIPVLALFAIKPLRRQTDDASLGHGARLAVSLCVVTLVFYTIPASKRSVYLLPMYPFLSLGIAYLWHRLASGAPRIGDRFSGLIRGVGATVAVALLAAPLQPWVEGMSVWVCLPFAIATGTITIRGRHTLTATGYTLSLILLVYTAVSIAVLPPVMEAKTDRQLAEAIEARAGADDHVWELITQDRLLRYYTAGFYLDDRIRLLPDSIPAEGGWLIASPDDAAALAGSHPEIRLSEQWSKPRSCDTRRPVSLYRLDLRQI